MRRQWALVKHLPADSATVAAVRAADRAPDRVERDPGKIAAFFGRFGMGK